MHSFGILYLPLGTTAFECPVSHKSHPSFSSRPYTACFMSSPISRCLWFCSHLAAFTSSAYSFLPDFQVMQNSDEHLESVLLIPPPPQIRKDKQWFANKVYSSSSGLREGTGNHPSVILRIRAPLHGRQGWVKNHKTFLPFWGWVFFTGHCVSCCKPLFSRAPTNSVHTVASVTQLNYVYSYL